MKYSTVFWDWNGTIIDDIGANMESLNEMFRKRGMKQFASTDDYFEVFGFPIIDFYIKVGFDFSREPFETLAAEYVAGYKRLSKSCKVFPDVFEAVEVLRDMGVKQIILSASEKEGLVGWLKRLDILSLFDEVIGNDNILAEGKADIAQNYLLSHPEINAKGSLLIGDTVHDFDVAQAMGCDCILIPRGHSSESSLRASGARVMKNAKSIPDIILGQM